VIAVRLGMLVVAALLILAAFGATSADMPPSALRVLVTTVVALLAPLFWPGNAATPARTVLRITVWSVAAACMAAIALRILGSPPQPFARLLGPCVMLVVILVLTHAVAALIEWRLRARSRDMTGAREMASRMVVMVLALLGSLPLWLGPVGELLSRRYEWIIDKLVGVSPLTHLAVASENDLLRNQWFYQHSNLAALQFSYPSLVQLAVAYVTVLLMVIVLAFLGRGSVMGADRIDLANKE
jgi:hypothetical protein